MRAYPILSGFLSGFYLLGVAKGDDRTEETSDNRQRMSLQFEEGFEDDRLHERGWYDGKSFVISPDDPHAGNGSLEYRWKEGGTTPGDSSAVRRQFTPSEGVHLEFQIKLSENWGWSGRPYHPHMIYFLTTANGKYHGPALSHLTVYVEAWDGKLRLATQDRQNEDQPHGLTQGPLRGGYNGRHYDSEKRVFENGKWHRVEAYFRLNTLDAVSDRPNEDGIVRAWFDGELVIDESDVVLRSTDFPDMKFNQLLIGPYFGDGLLPYPQSLWIDELTVKTD